MLVTPREGTCSSWSFLGRVTGWSRCAVGLWECLEGRLGRWGLLSSPSMGRVLSYGLCLHLLTFLKEMDMGDGGSRHDLSILFWTKPDLSLNVSV